MPFSEAAQVVFSEAVTFAAINANSEGTVTIGVGKIIKLALGNAIPIVHLRAGLDVGIIMKAPARLDVVTATGVTTVKFDLANITAGPLTQTAMTVDCWIL